MRKEILGLTSIKTLRKIKHRSIPKAEGTDDAELYLLRNNLILANRERASVEKRKESVEVRIKEIEMRIAELESGLKRKRPKKRIAPQPLKSGMQVMKVDY